MRDDPTAFEGIELPTTTTWETRPGRLGMRFTCKDRTPELLAKYGKKPNLSQLKLFKDGKHVGEVKLERAYQVIPPSWKTLYYVDGVEVDKPDYDKAEPSKRTTLRTDYKLLDSSPSAEISLGWLLSELHRMGITFSSKLDQNDKEAGMHHQDRQAGETWTCRGPNQKVRIGGAPKGDQYSCQRSDRRQEQPAQ